VRRFWFSGFLGVNPEVLRSLWLKASVIGEGDNDHFEFYPGIFLTTEEKHGKPLSE
jgi:hypothetical protein